MQVMMKYMDAIRQTLDKVNATQTEAMEKAADMLADATLHDRNIFAFGCNHAGLLALEMYYRTGGMVNINPVRGPGLQLDVDPATLTSQMERLPGYGRILMEQIPLEQGAYFDDPRLHAQVRRMEQGSDNLLARYGYVREGAVYRVAGQAEGERIAVFCHQGIAATWISYLLHMPYQAGWAGLWQACTSVTEITMERRSAGYAVPRMLKMGSTAHLELAGLDSDEFGLAVNVTG